MKLLCSPDRTPNAYSHYSFKRSFLFSVERPVMTAGPSVDSSGVHHEQLSRGCAEREGASRSSPAKGSDPAGPAGRARPLPGRRLRSNLPGGAHGACGDLDGPDLQRHLVHGEMDLAPHAPASPAVLACMPFAFAADLDAGAVYYPAGHHALMSRKGTSRCSGPALPRYGSCTASVLCLRHSVL